MACNNLEEQLLAKVGGGPFPLDRYFEKSYSKLFGNIWHDAVLFMESIKKSWCFLRKKFYIDCSFLFDFSYFFTSVSNIFLQHFGRGREKKIGGRVFFFFTAINFREENLGIKIFSKVYNVDREKIGGRIFSFFSATLF